MTENRGGREQDSQNVVRTADAYHQVPTPVVCRKGSGAMLQIIVYDKPIIRIKLHIIRIKRIILSGTKFIGEKCVSLKSGYLLCSNLKANEN